MFLVLLLFLILGSTFTVGKAAIAYAPFMYMLSIRMLLAGFLLLGYLFFFDKSRWKFDKKDLFTLAQLAFFHIFLTFVPEFWGMQYLSSSKTCLLFNLSPFVTALFSYFFLSERMNLKKWFGLALGVAGFLPILLTQSPQEDALGTFGGISYPELSLFISVLSSAYAWILMKRMVQKKGYSPLMINGIAMAGGGFLTLITAFLYRIKFTTATNVARDDAIGHFFAKLFGTNEIGGFLFIFYTLLLILLANFICYNLYGYLLRRYSATFMAFAGFTAPLFAALWGWLLLGEKTGWAFFLSSGITFLGLYIFHKEEVAS